ncbi:monoacylglycerol lipase abhd6-A-like [Nelusetta ayraudi]|uniref:monoacylglycerol lipase abhd6-A-like n=1 Tax=Nelusetta ayraudi TaxID=303726 RepID=UPI003F718D69
MANLRARGRGRGAGRAAMELITLAGGLVVVPLFTFITSLIFCPGKLLKAYNWYMRRKIGLVVRYSYNGSYRFCYSSRGTPGGSTPSLLLLHSFSVSKDMWLTLVPFLPESQHVVCLDMPGHEGTSRTGPEDYSIPGQVHRVHQFVQSIGLDKRPFHLLGASMGGNVAGVYAAQYSSFLSGVTLVCPSGLIYPKETKFVARLREIEKVQQGDSIPLIPSTLPELRDMLNLSCYKPQNLPGPALRGLLDNRIPNNAFYKELFMELVRETSRHSLQENMRQITSPVQVIWGKEDEVLHVSGAAVLQAALSNCQVDLVDNCGHSVWLERPRKAAKLIIDFLTAQGLKGEGTKKSL